jgi:hypothetical protein
MTVPGGPTWVIEDVLCARMRIPKTTGRSIALAIQRALNRKGYRIIVTGGPDDGRAKER